MLINFKIPAPSSMLTVNLLGALGLIGLAAAVGGLTHNVWWALAVASVEAVFLSVVAATHLAGAEHAAQARATAEDLAATVRPRAV